MQLINLAKTRWILVLPMALCGILYLTHLTGWSQINKGILPGDPVIWSVLAGVGLLAGAASIASRKFDRYAALSIALLLTLFTAAVYTPCISDSDITVRISSAFNLTKDMVLAAGSLAYAGLASARL